LLTLKKTLSTKQAGSVIVFTVAATDGGRVPLTGSATVEVTILSNTASAITEVTIDATETMVTHIPAATETVTSTGLTSQLLTDETTLSGPKNNQLSGKGEDDAFVIVVLVFVPLAVVVVCASLALWRCYKKDSSVNGRHFVSYSSMLQTKQIYYVHVFVVLCD